MKFTSTLAMAAAILHCGVAMVRAEEILVFAAASLRESLEAATMSWETRTDNRAVISFAGSSVLARQIQAGAPADLFISANAAWVDVLERDGLLVSESRVDLLGNTLVVIAHDPTEPPLDFDVASDLADRLGQDRLAMALTNAVPAGIYGKAALGSLGWWNGIADHVAETDSVRAALALVATGEAPFGIVYATDALAEPRVSVIGVFPRETHPPIVYPAAAIAGGRVGTVRNLVGFLSGPEGGRIFAAHGFDVIGQGE